MVGVVVDLFTVHAIYSSFHTCEIFKALPNVATMWTNTRRRNTLISSNTLKSQSMSRPSRNESVMLGIPSASKQMAVQHESNTFNLKIRFDDWVRAFSFSHPHSYPANQRALARLRELIRPVKIVSSAFRLIEDFFYQ